MSEDLDYEKRKEILEACKEQGLIVFGTQAIMDAWFDTKSDSFWDLSPIELIQSGKGEEVLSLLQAKVKEKKEQLSPVNPPIPL